MTPDYRLRFYQRYVETHVRRNGEALLEGRAPYLSRLVKTHFPQNREACILELGCGHGAFIYFARQLGYQNIRGVDLSPDQVRTAHQLGIAGVAQGDSMATLKAAHDSSLDMVIAMDVFEHLSKKELLDLVDEIRRVLKKQGHLLLHVPNAVSPFFGRVRYGDYTHEVGFTQSSLTQLLSTAGFKEVTCYEESPTIHGFNSAIRWLVWKLSRTLMRIVLLAETGAGNEIFSQNLLAVAKRG